VTADPNEMAAEVGQDDPFAAEKEALRAAERERLRALREADMAVAERLHADEYQIIAPPGATVSKREYLDPIASHEFTYRMFEPISPIVVRVSDQLAAVRYRARIEVGVTSGATDSGTFWQTNIYEKRNGQWQVVWSHETRIPSGD
jgi:uncharacterized protein DUF4440